MSLFDNMSGKNQKTSAKKSASKTSHNDIENAEEFAYLSGFDKNDSMMRNLKAQKQTGSDFNEEFSEQLMEDVSRFSIQSYSKAGVSFEKLSESQAKISYAGLLAQSGAKEVFGVYGYGSNQKWEDVNTLILSKAGDSSFTATVPIEQGKNINWAFKDSVENWDNNSGMNYTFVN